MNLAEAAASVKKKRICKCGVVLLSLDDDDLATFKQWVDDGKACGWMAEVLHRVGITINRDTIKAHIKGLCICSEDIIYRGVVSFHA